jgi:hypothetical protein
MLRAGRAAEAEVDHLLEGGGDGQRGAAATTRRCRPGETACGTAQEGQQARRRRGCLFQFAAGAGVGGVAAAAVVLVVPVSVLVVIVFAWFAVFCIAYNFIG